MLRLLVFLAAAATTAAAELAFSRIVHGWPNYSTAFSTTHDTSANGEFATAATFYTPPYTVRALEFSTIVIWSEAPPQVVDFSAFTFAVCFWTSLDAFIRDPAHGDLANLAFAKPARIAVDTTTRGGRPAYEIRFALTNGVTLSSCQTYLIGLIAKTDTSREGELYVPTAGTEGASDVQAGNIVPFGWQYLIDAGGFTVYDGQLASELIVERLGEPPRLSIAQTNSTVRLTWQASANCYRLEATEALNGLWTSVTNEPEIGPLWQTVSLPHTNGFSFFRLAR
jgi:hypothetical protein